MWKTHHSTELKAQLSLKERKLKFRKWEVDPKSPNAKLSVCTPTFERPLSMFQDLILETYFKLFYHKVSRKKYRECLS